MSFVIALYGSDGGLFHQKLLHFLKDQFLLDDETVIMPIGDLYNLRVMESVLKFGNDRPENKLPVSSKILTIRGFCSSA